MDQVDRQLVEILDRVGGSVTERELRYQLGRRGDVPDDLLDRLAELEGGGIVASELTFELTRTEARAA
jgi:hypothetical protein